MWAILFTTIFTAKALSCGSTASSIQETGTTTGSMERVITLAKSKNQQSLRTLAPMKTKCVKAMVSTPQATAPSMMASGAKTSNRGQGDSKTLQAMFHTEFGMITSLSQKFLKLSFKRKNHQR